MFNILVVEDDVNTGKLFKIILEINGYVPCVVGSAEEALEQMDTRQFDLIISDIMLPGEDGYSYIKLLRQSDLTVPILVVSAKSAPADIVTGLSVGADDYIGKPFDEQELIMRIKALFRRSRLVDAHQYTHNGITLDYDTFSVIGNGQTASLRKKEFQLLYKLLVYPNKVFTRRQLLDEIWGLDNEGDEHTVTVHINRLRSRFEDYPQFEIVTMRGLGYMGKWNE